MAYRTTIKTAVRVALAVALVAASIGAPVTAQAASGGSGASRGHDPSHPYRHGLHHARGHAAATSSGGQLRYGGGVGGVGVTTGPPRVYLVFWGSQWGAQSTDANGYLRLGGDAYNTAPLLQGFFKGLGTGSETWSGVMTQYCEGVATASTSCPGSAPHVGYPTGGALAGVWADEAAAAPAQASGNGIGAEAVTAAAHFGNTTSASNRNTQYVILSPSGTHPDGFNTPGANWCAWHDYTGDTTLSGGAVSSPYGQLAFTNMPYVIDMGTSCGSSFVNAGSAGATDGVSIVEGHEYAETITDQLPSGGWTDTTGYENGDKCAWISSGQGASQNITLSTGSYAVQSTWSNDYGGGAGGCQVSHPVVGGGPPPANDFSLTVSPATRSVPAGGGTSYTIGTGVTSGSASSVTLSVSGLPAGAAASFSTHPVTAGGSSTMTVTTSASTAATSSTLTVKGDNGSSTHTATATLTVTAPAPGGGPPVTNGGFETGDLSGWTPSGVAAGISTTGHSGAYSALVGATSPTNGDSSISQTFTVPASGGSLSFYYRVVCPDTVTYDWATATLKDNTSGTTATVLGKTCTNTGAWAAVSYGLASSAGHSVTLTLVSHDDNYTGDATYTLYDDVTISAPVISPVVNGGFETGSLSGWTSSGVRTGVSSTGHSGSYSAMAGNTSATNGDSSVSQTFTLPAGVTAISFYYRITCPDTVTYDWATATLKDNTANTTSTVLSKTCTNNGAWAQVTYNVSSRAGHSVTLTLTSHDDNYAGDATYTLFDDVTVS